MNFFFILTFGELDFKLCRSIIIIWYSENALEVSNTGEI